MQLKVLFGIIFCGFVKAEFGCQPGWSLYSDNCYQWFAGLHTDYESAVHVCERANAKMLTINSEAEHDFITDRFSHIDDNIWFDGANSDFDNWNVTKAALKDEICAAIRFEPRGHPIWIHSKCHYFNDVVCKGSRKPTNDSFCDFAKQIEIQYNCESPNPSPTPGPSPSPTPGTCDPGWTEFKGQCYLLTCDTTLGQNQALYACQQLNSTLASIHSFDQNSFVVSLAQNCTENWIHVGAKVVVYRPPKLVWMDGTPFDFSFIPNGELRSQDPADDGIQIQIVDKHWYNFYSYDTRQMSYVCTKPSN